MAPLAQMAVGSPLPAEMARREFGTPSAVGSYCNCATIRPPWSQWRSVRTAGGWQRLAWTTPRSFGILRPAACYLLWPGSAGGLAGVAFGPDGTHLATAGPAGLRLY